MSFIWKANERLKTPEQVAREVHAISLQRDLDEFATVLACMCIRQESNFWCPWNDNDPDSKNYPFDSQSDDGRSVGYFQQQNGEPGEVPANPRNNWWGSMAERMDLSKSANNFLGRLTDDYYQAEGNPSLATEFISNVQRPREDLRGAYAKHYDFCIDLVHRALAEQPTPIQGEPITPIPVTGGNSVISGDPVWLEDVLRPALGNRLKTLPGWQTDGVGGTMGQIWGVVWHHTGNAAATAQSISEGRPDLAGPLSQLHIAPDGTVTIVAVGPCNHAGAGSWPGLPTDAANDRTIGIECAWPRDTSITEATQRREPWPDAQIIAMRDTGAALTKHLNVPVSHNISHKEWATQGPAGRRQGKWDPGNLDMNWFRGEIQKAINGEFEPKPPVPPGQVVPPASDHQLLIEIWDQLRIEWPQLGNRTLVDAVAELLKKSGA